jgi:protein-ribulosamine 3-kinase
MLFAPVFWRHSVSRLLKHCIQTLSETHTLRIPKVFYYGVLPGGKGAFVVMEHIAFGGRSSQEELGRGLAQMHMCPCQDPNAQKGMFGFEVDNTIGGTQQVRRRGGESG